MLLIKSVRMVDWRRSSITPYDILIEDGRIRKIDSEINLSGVPVIYGAGLTAIPGMVDAHVHLRQPGYEYKETVETATRAAAAGGVTALCAMPNVKPCPDSPENLENVRAFQRDSKIRIIQSCAINRDLDGERSDWKELLGSGARFFTNDGLPVDRVSDMVEILKFSRETGVVVGEHPEAPGMDEKIHNAEAMMICRDIFLNERIGGNLHIQHISLAESVRYLEKCRHKNIKFTVETCPHYFCEVEKGLEMGMYEVYPPLRNEEDRQAIIWALSTRLISIIASDHAPHSIEDKKLDKPARGFSGIELLFSLCYNSLVRKAIIDLERLVEFLSLSPSLLLGIEPVCFETGKRADIVLFDPDEEWCVEESAMYSKGKNTPFMGSRLKGRIKYTIASGEVIYPFGELR
ncbi:MAG TPA: dihydroorotase [Mesotoga sp.]|nr:dihydroorotase [Mesotoga sp.]